MNPREISTRPRRLPWWLLSALSLALIASALPFAARIAAGPEGARVHVRWTPETAQAERERLEATFGLTQREPLGNDTWRYNLIDPSEANLRAVVRHPTVADTHDIDRERFAVSEGAVRTSRAQRLGPSGDALVLLLDAAAVVLVAGAVLLALLGVSGRAESRSHAVSAIAELFAAIYRVCAAFWNPVTRFLQRGVPDIDPSTAGLFRIVFGVCVLAFFADHPVDAAMLDRTFDVNVNGDAHALILGWLRDHPVLVNSITPAMLTLGVAFVAGLFTRTTYALFVILALAWAYVAVYVDSTHPHSTLMLTLVALLPSRWGDALSIDAKLRPRRHVSGKRYGYSVWIPGLVFGIAFAAAAWAKLTSSGSWTSWVMNGTVKYHFVTDSIAAPVDWGLQFVNHPAWAVIASFMALATEALVIAGAFVRRELYRGMLGLAAVSLLAGFWLFMGVVWAGWWILLLGFLPWKAISTMKPAVAVAGPSSLTAPQAGLICFVLVQQLVVSWIVIERAPMFTFYPMYSATWASAEDFNASRPLAYRVLVTTPGGKMQLRCSPSERLVTEFREALNGSTDAAESVWRQLRGCEENLQQAQSVTFEGYSRTFDFERLEFTMTPTAGILGPLPAKWQE